jgi:hypothetical protein
MRQSRSRARRCPTHTLLRLETLEDRTVLNVAPVGVADFGSLVVDSAASNPSQILVRFRPGAAPNVAAILSGTTLRSALGNNLWTVRLAPGVNVQAALAAYTSHASVDYAQEDFRVRIAGPEDDPQYPSLWGLNNTGQTGGHSGRRH